MIKERLGTFQEAIHIMTVTELAQRWRPSLRTEFYKHWFHVSFTKFCFIQALVSEIEVLLELLLIWHKIRNLKPTT